MIDPDHYSVFNMKYTVLRALGLLLSLIALSCGYSQEVLAQDDGASIYLSPSQGTFEVGSTFDLSFFVNTGGIDINAVRMEVQFPPEMIQVADPSVGNSFVSIWVEQPQYSNTDGIIFLQGGLPDPGINTTAGLISQVSFRAKRPGRAVLKVLGTSSVLANDGLGSDVLSIYGSGEIDIVIPAPEGPVIRSPSHGDQSHWYRENNVTIGWEMPQMGDELDGVPVAYSWSFDNDPLGIPDNETEDSDESVQFDNVEDGIWYFHVKAKMGDEWGSTSHFPVKVDNMKPAEFEPIIDPASGSFDSPRILTFLTTDRHAGIDHYEMRVESISDPESMEQFFIDVTSPYTIKDLSDGTYEVTVRAFDKAGNWKDGVVEFKVHTAYVRVVNGCIVIGGYAVPGGHLLLSVAAMLSIVLIFFYIRRRKHNSAVSRRNICNRKGYEKKWLESGSGGSI